MSDLKKDLSSIGLTMIVIGSCIGVGIFVTPARIFKDLPHHGFVMLAWLLGGIVTFFGAMTFSELSARFPKAGGVYVFLREAYGKMAGFLYGWIILLIVTTGALAALSVALTDFLEYFFEMGDNLKRAIAIGTLLLLTGVNIIGVNISGLFAKLFTGLKLLALIAIILLGIVFFDSAETSHQLNFNFSQAPDNIGSLILVAFTGVFFSFGGWHHATYLSGETKNPQSTVPKAMLFGTLTVTLFYLLAVFAYSSLLPMDQIINSDRIAGDAVGNVIKGGGKLVAIGISISIFGTIGIYTMTAPRIYYAMAKDGVFFKTLAKVHPKYKTPHYAMLFQCGWAILLIILFKDFHHLMTFATFMDILFMALAASTIFVFRRRNKDQSPAYKLKLFPLIPILYLIVAIAFVINMILNIDSFAMVGLGILFLGIPTYIFFERNKKSLKNMN